MLCKLLFRLYLITYAYSHCSCTLSNENISQGGGGGQGQPPTLNETLPTVDMLDCSGAPCLPLPPYCLPGIYCPVFEHNCYSLFTVSPCTGFSLPDVNTTLPTTRYTSLPNHLVSCSAVTFTLYLLISRTIKSTFLFFPYLLCYSLSLLVLQYLP